MVEQRLNPERQLKEYAQELLSSVYVQQEISRAEVAVSGGKIMRTSSIRSPKIRAILDDMGVAEQGILEEARSHTQKQVTAEVLSLIENPNDKLELEINALLAARRYWEDTLEGPDKAFDLIVLGRNRIKEINAEIEKLTNPDNQQKNNP